MRGPQPIYCDHCQKLKGESNHWFTIYSLKESFQLGIEDFSKKPKKSNKVLVLDVCGEGCLQMTISRLIHEPKEPKVLPKEEPFPGDPVGDCEIGG